MVNFAQWRRYIPLRSAPPRPSEWPLPPEHFRRLVGLADPAYFNNPDGGPAFRDITLPIPQDRLYSRVFDLGCGCGRQARQLVQMRQPPQEYVGVDISKPMIRWCQDNLIHPGFSFHHHDVYDSVYASNNSRHRTRPLPFPRDHFTLLNAHSVFTHLLIDQTRFYLKELRDLATGDGVIRTTWFFFNRDMIPVLNPDQHCMFINDEHPTHAVYYAWSWFQSFTAELGLLVADVQWSPILGHQNTVLLTKDPAIGKPADQFTPSSNVIGY